MNQYGRGKHEPDFSIEERIAQVPDVPEAFFYTKDEDVTWLLVAFNRMDKDRRRLRLEAGRGLADKE